MSTKLKKSSKKVKAPDRPDAKGKALDSSFDRGLWKKAKEIGLQYKIVIEPDATGEVGYVGYAIEMPNVFADGTTRDDCLRATIEALTTAIATMLEMGRKPPRPNRPGVRNEQLNLRLSKLEKAALESTADRYGFRSISDFVRTAALRECEI